MYLHFYQSLKSKPAGTNSREMKDNEANETKGCDWLDVAEGPNRWKEPLVPGEHGFKTLTTDTALTSMVELWGYGV